jgi:hypothetical protein
MSAFLIAYTMIGLVTWAGIVIEFHVEGGVWRLREAHHVPLTMVGVTALWLPAMAFWQFRKWSRESSHD